MWNALVDLVRATIFAGSHLVGGSLGAGVILVSAVVRLALTPLVLRQARYARAQQEIMKRLAPQIERLKRRFANDRWRFAEEQQKLFAANGVKPFGGPTLVSTAIQLPLLAALFSAIRNGLGARVRFLWIADLSRADAFVALGAAALSGFAMSVAPAPVNAQMPAKLPLFIAFGATLVFLWSASSAVALSVGAGSAVTAFQNWLIAQEVKADVSLPSR